MRMDDAAAQGDNSRHSLRAARASTDVCDGDGLRDGTRQGRAGGAQGGVHRVPRALGSDGRACAGRPSQGGEAGEHCSRYSPRLASRAGRVTRGVDEGRFTAGVLERKLRFPRIWPTRAGMGLGSARRPGASRAARRPAFARLTAGTGSTWTTSSTRPSRGASRTCCGSSHPRQGGTSGR